MIRVLLPVLSTASRLRLPAISHYIYVGLTAIAISHLNSYLQPHHSPMASTVPTLTYPQAEALCASNYPCPPGDRKSTRLNSSHSGESRMPSSA